MRYRGSIEYEKMILNILSFYNEVSALCEDEQQESELQQTLASYIKQCAMLLNEYQSQKAVSMQLLQKESENFIAFEQGIGESY